MFVKGCVPHSGPSKNPPVTGTPCWFGYLSARKNSGLVDTMPIAPLERASWTAVATPDGLVWSSRTIPVSLCPLTPPSAFCSATRALNPAAAWLNSEAPAGQRADHGDGDRRARRCRASDATDRAGDADHRRHHEHGDPQRTQVLPPTSTHLPPLCSGNPAGPPAESSHACTPGTQKAVARLRRMRAAHVGRGRQRLPAGGSRPRCDAALALAPGSPFSCGAVRFLTVPGWAGIGATGSWAGEPP